MANAVKQTKQTKELVEPVSKVRTGASPVVTRRHAGIIFILVLFALCVPLRLNASCLASWYDCAGLTCASWDYPLGTRLRVTEIHNRLSVIVTVNDRGPAGRLYRQGRKIDLSRAAFQRIDGLALGLAEVRIEEIK